MCFLDRTPGRWFGLALAALAATSCSSPAFRDFSTATVRPSAIERTPAIPALIDANGAQPVDLDSFLAPIRERAHIPAIAAAVLRGNQIVAQGVAGVRRHGSDAAVTLDDRFQIASCAKAMSATLVAR